MRSLMKMDKITDHSETRNIDEVLHVSPLQAHQRLPGQQNKVFSGNLSKKKRIGYHNLNANLCSSLSVSTRNR